MHEKQDTSDPVAGTYGACIKLLLFTYGPISKNAIALYFCFNVTSHMLLVADNSVECSGKEYSAARNVSIAVLVGAVIGIPVVMQLLLFFRRNDLHDPRFERMLGALYLKYEKKYYFWDVVVLVRRLVIVTCTQLEHQPDIRSFLLLLTTGLSMLLHWKCQPFVELLDNRLEMVSLALLFVCSCFIDSGLTYLLEWVVLAVGLIFGICVVITVGVKIHKQRDTVRWVVAEYTLKLVALLITLPQKIAAKFSK